MKLTKICPYCKARFTTDINAKKYCRRQCAVLASRKKPTTPKNCLCLWCGQVFKATRKRKFCKPNCRLFYLRQLDVYLRTEYKVPVKISVNDVAKQCKIQGISYGKYVCLKKL